MPKTRRERREFNADTIDTIVDAAERLSVDGKKQLAVVLSRIARCEDDKIISYRRDIYGCFAGEFDLGFQIRGRVSQNTGSLRRACTEGAKQIEASLESDSEERGNIEVGATEGASMFGRGA